MDNENLLFSIRILVVDDDEHLRSVLCNQLRNKGVLSLAEASRAGEALKQFDQFKPDLVLLDVGLPDGNGFEICKVLRNRGFKKPIIMLTGRQDEKALDTGANDYIAKPMRFRELFSRITAQLRQYKAANEVSFTTQNVEFQPASKTLTSLDTQRTIVLTEKETMILKKLFQIDPESISKEHLLSEVWGYRNVVATHTLETHIYRLRQKIFRLVEAPLIETTQDGYRITQSL